MKVAVLLFCITCLSFTAFSQPAWQAGLDSDIRFYQTTDFGIVIVGTEKNLYAIDGQTGERLWRRSTGKINETAVTPIPDTDLILFSQDLGSKSRLEAVDIMSGARIWQSEKVKGDVMQLAVDPENDLLAVVLVKDARGNAADGLKRKPVVHVLRLTDGDELWKRDFDNSIEMMPVRFGEDGEVDHTLDNYRAPLILDGRLYLFYEGSTSYDARTGKEKEREKFKINEDGLALTEADPVFNDTHVFVSGKGRIRAINRRSGQQDWKADDLGISAEMALVGNILYVRTGGQFTRLKDGEIQEKAPFGVSAINAQTGKTLWRYKGANKGLTNFVLGRENLILVADKDNVIAINVRSGRKEWQFDHKIDKPQFILINEVGDAVVGGRNEIASFDFFHRYDASGTTRFTVNGVTSAPRPILDEKWRVRHTAPGRGVFRVVAAVALRAVALYFRYGGLATSGINLARGGLSLARTANSFRWSGLKTRFGSVDLTTLASNAARNYVSGRIYAYGSLARMPGFVGNVRGLQISRPSIDLLGRVTPSRADVQEGILDRLDPARQMEKLSGYLRRRERLSALRAHHMYFYTDLPRPFDKKGLVGVNVHTGQDQRFALVSEPDPRFTTDENIGFLYSADGSRLQAFDIIGR
jgi:outer membrane protein assembly factor BamB